MGKIKKQLHVRGVNGDMDTIDLYDDIVSCPEPNLPIKIKDKIVYAKLGNYTGEGASIIKVHRDSDNADYSILRKSYLTVTINQSSNQQITVTHKGIEHTETFLCPYGDNITTNIKATTAKYEPGDLNIAEMVKVESNLNIEATIAILSGSFTAPTTVTIPENITVIQVVGKYTSYVGVTPGKVYTLARKEEWGGKTFGYRYYVYNTSSAKTWGSVNGSESIATCSYSATINKVIPKVEDY